MCEAQDILTSGPKHTFTSFTVNHPQFHSTSARVRLFMGKLFALYNQTILSSLCGVALSLPEIPDN